MEYRAGSWTLARLKDGKIAAKLPDYHMFRLPSIHQSTHHRGFYNLQSEKTTATIAGATKGNREKCTCCRLTILNVALCALAYAQPGAQYSARICRTRTTHKCYKPLSYSQFYSGPQSPDAISRLQDKPTHVQNTQTHLTTTKASCT